MTTSLEEIEDDSSENENPFANNRLEESSDSDNDEINDNFNGKKSLKRKNDTDKSEKYKKIKLQDSTKGKDKKHFSKPVTVEELNQLREIENSYNSNLFRIQIEELLSEVSVKKKHSNNFTKWMSNHFQPFLNSLTEYDDITLSKIKMPSSKKQKKKKSFINQLLKGSKDGIQCDQDVTLKFLRPEACNIFGLYKINSTLGSNLNVDVNIQMPRKCFNEKDYLNNRYFVKRFYYLKYLQVELSKTDIVGSVVWSYYNSNALLPVLILTPNNLNKIQIKVFVSAPENYFKFSRCLPDKINVKVNVFKGEFFDISNEDFNTGTVLYNATLLHDLTLNVNNNYIEQVLHEHKTVQEGIKLLLVWLKQRELNVGFGSFSDELIPYFMTYLVMNRKINKHMSAYQVIRSFWIFMGMNDLRKNPISICEDVKLAMFQNVYETVFIDRSGCYNLMSFVNVDVYDKIRLESQLAVKYLDNNKFNSFTPLFMTKLPFFIQYDAVVSLSSAKMFKNIYTDVNVETKVANIGFYNHIVIRKITQIYKQGLTNRIINIVPFVKEVLGKNQLNKIMFGVCLNVEKAFSIIERGPLPTDPSVKEFLNFWGDMAHFRRFPDGTACDAVYFETKTIKDRRNIIRQILTFITERKLNVTYSLCFDDFEKVLIPYNLITPYPVGTSEDANLKAINISDGLNQILRNLKLPLEVVSVQGISSVFSYTNLFPPISTNYKVCKKVTCVEGNNIIFNKEHIGMVPRYLEPIECVIQLGHHSKWPNSLEAIRHVKMGFYLRIAKLLEEQGIKSNVKMDYFDVFYEGLVFRFIMYLSKEASYLKKDVTVNGLVTYKDTEKSIEYETKLNILPKIIGALKGIQMEYPSFGPSTALIKRWLRSQLLDEFHVPDVVIELLNVSLFLNPAPFAVSNLPQLSFIRFLKLMFEINWEIEPLFVNFNDELTKEVIDEIENEFRKSRQAYPNLFIVTPYDTKSLYSKCVSKETLRRISILAKEMFSILEKNVLQHAISDINIFFTPNMDGYDLLIHLKPPLNSRGYQQVDSKNNLEVHLEVYDANRNATIPIVDFNPVDKYLKELRKFYSEFALFFHDTYGGNVIAVLWKPFALKEREFKTSQIDGKMLVDDKLRLNVDAIVEDFQILGSGVVKCIEKNNK